VRRLVVLRGFSLGFVEELEVLREVWRFVLEGLCGGRRGCVEGDGALKQIRCGHLSCKMFPVQQIDNTMGATATAATSGSGLQCDAKKAKSYLIGGLGKTLFSNTIFSPAGTS
jgi:hypothetical protein